MERWNAKWIDEGRNELNKLMKEEMNWMNWWKKKWKLNSIQWRMNYELKELWKEWINERWNKKWIESRIKKELNEFMKQEVKSELNEGEKRMKQTPSNFSLYLKNIVKINSHEYFCSIELWSMFLCLNKPTPYVSFNSTTFQKQKKIINNAFCMLLKYFLPNSYNIK